jgi:hypothetical protein
VEPEKGSHEKENVAWTAYSCEVGRADVACDRVRHDEPWHIADTIINGAHVESEPAFTSKAPIILDIGGEGRHPEAWNLNPRTRKTVGPHRGEPIPRLIQGRGEFIPLSDRMVDVLIVERTPLRLATLSEVLRVASLSAQIILRHANAHLRDPHHLAVRILGGTVEQRMAMIGMQPVQETVVRLSQLSPISNCG